ncbi:hypothetical protein DRP77_03520 [Candidatus Poribacteria bacterium]|nr:MAG: hypothetical protein DRP77_03520 [Candidatus Poribacteria bacterium]
MLSEPVCQLAPHPFGEDDRFYLLLDLLEAFQAARFSVDQLPPEMKRLIGSMREGEWGGPVETPAGYVIVKLIDRKPRRLKSFDEVKEEIKSIILSERVRRELTNWLRKQRKEADIRIIEPNLR